jgi:hypothetical protein
MNAPAERHEAPLVIWICSPPDVLRVTGLDRDAFREVLAEMKADPIHGAHVIHLSKKRQGVPLAAFLEWLRSRAGGAK